jgi:hypothetical protein
MLKRLLIVLLVLGLLLSITGVSLPDQAISSIQGGVSIYLTDVEQAPGITVTEEAKLTRAASPKVECPASDVTVMNTHTPKTVEETHTPETAIPEFATIALPVAGILVLFLFFSHRRRQ